MKLTNLVETNGKTPSVLLDPFKSDKIEEIRIRVSRGLFDKSIYSARGSVEFTNGMTSGEQKFEGDTFESVYYQIKSFLETL